MRVMERRDIKAIRRANLRRLIAGVGSVKRLAEQSETNPDWLSALSSDRPPKTAAGQDRGIGDKLARKLEKGGGKPRGWMDQTHELSDIQVMWVDKFAKLPPEMQERALEYLEMLYVLAEAKNEKPPPKAPEEPESQD